MPSPNQSHSPRAGPHARSLLPVKQTCAWCRLATEGARECLRDAFENRTLGEAIAFTVPVNRRSRRVMEKLGTMRDPTSDFAHPRLPEGHPPRGGFRYRCHGPATL